MEIRLLVAVPVYREQFVHEHFTGADHIFALVKSGRFRVETADGVFEVGEGEGFVFHKSIPYYRTVLSPVWMYLFRYESESALFRENPVRFRDAARVKSTVAALDELERNASDEDFFYRQHLFTDLVMQHFMEQQVTVRHSVAADERIEAAIVHMKEKLRYKLNMEEIAGECGLSYVQFYRRFQACTGVTPSKFLGTLRVQKAKGMLLDNTLSVKSIAFACGFENEYYFSNFFKKNTGLSPTAFRNSSL